MAGLVPPAASMDDWIRGARARPARGPAGRQEAERRRRLREAAATLRATGTVLVGDISNTLITPRSCAESGLGGVVFHELHRVQCRRSCRRWFAMRGLRDQRARLPRSSRTEPAIQFSVVAHAPYSVSPALFRDIVESSEHRAAVDSSGRVGRGGRVSADRAADRFARRSRSSASGPDAWSRAGVDPVRYLADARLPAAGHARRARRAPDRRRAGSPARSGRGAGHVSAQQPVGRRRAAAAGAFLWRRALPVAIGTDSLASVADAESVRRTGGDAADGARRSRPATLLDSATRAGAEALGLRRATTARSRRGSGRGLVGRGRAGRRARCGRISGRRRAGRTRFVASRDLTPSRTFMWSRLRTYASFVRFSHSVFALPFALVGALAGGAHGGIRVAPRDLDRRLHGGRAQRRDGIQPAGRRALRRAESAHRIARAAGRPHDARREARLFVVVSSLAFVACASQLGVVCASCCRRSRSRSCSGIRWPSA